MVHELKIEPEHYAAIKMGRKSFEVRKNDRDYQIGDILGLNEYADGKYTGRAVLREIIYIFNNPHYCKDGFVILGVAPIHVLPGFEKEFIREEGAGDTNV